MNENDEYDLKQDFDSYMSKLNKSMINGMEVFWFVNNLV